jgi:hypothetical protein
MLSNAQLQILKADILADSELNAIPNTPDGAFAIAEVYNAVVSPDFWVWRTSVDVLEIMQNGFVWSAVDGLTAGKARIWEWMASTGVINPSRTNVRSGLVDAFGSNTAMANGIRPHLSRQATRAQKLFADTSVGDGSSQNGNSPATMTYEAAILYQEVLEARNLA